MRNVIPIEKVTSIQNKAINEVALDMIDRVEGYLLAGGKTSITIPKSMTSDVLISERKKGITFDY